MQLVLGVKRFSPSEIKLLCSILRLTSGLTHSWTVSEDSACHVLLIGDVLPDEELPTDKEVGAIVVPVILRRIARTLEAEEYFLAQPIYAEELVTLLNRLSTKIVQAKKTNSSYAELAVQAAKRRVRLTRWPSQQLLAERRSYIHMATALSRSSQSIQSLSVLCNTPERECTHFLNLLEREGVLKWSSPVTIQSSSMSEQVSVAQTVSVQSSFSEKKDDRKIFREDKSLLARIRRSLGLA